MTDAARIGCDYCMVTFDEDGDQIHEDTCSGNEVVMLRARVAALRARIADLRASRLRLAVGLVALRKLFHDDEISGAAAAVFDEARRIVEEG